MSTELNHVGAWLKKLGSSQASDLASVVLPAISQCVKPSCKDRSEHSSAASKSVEREDLQGLFVTTLEATTLPQLQAHLRGARQYTTKCIPSPHAGNNMLSMLGVVSAVRMLYDADMLLMRKIRVVLARRR